MDKVRHGFPVWIASLAGALALGLACQVDPQFRNLPSGSRPLSPAAGDAGPAAPTSPDGASASNLTSNSATGSGTGAAQSPPPSLGTTAVEAPARVAAPEVLASVPELALQGDAALGTFARNAFPPTLSASDYHRNAWLRDDCMDCHASGREGAVIVKHEGMTPLLVRARCRSCHVVEPETDYSFDAFPPLLPADSFHADAWMRSDCLLCHESGVRGATVIRHRALPRAFLQARCRTCHVPSAAATPAPASSTATREP